MTQIALQCISKMSTRAATEARMFIDQELLNLDVGVGGQITKPRMTQWIQCKLGKQYL